MKNHQKTLLLVEDEAIIAMSGKMSLEKDGYAVLTVSTGEEAVKAVDATPEIDLILMDIDLGEGMDGTHAAALILSKHDIPVVFISSHTEPEIVEKTEKITSYGYVVKNSSITVIDASIKMAFKLFDSKLSEKNFIQSSPMGIHMYELNAEGNLVFLGGNKSADAMLGFDNSIFAGKPILEAFPSLRETEIPLRYAKAAADGESWRTEQMNYVDGRISGAFEVFAFQTSKNRMAAMFLNVTARKQTEERLIKSEIRYRTLFEKSNDAIFIVDTVKGAYLDANAAAEKLTGRTVAEITALKTADLSPQKTDERLSSCNKATETLLFDDVRYIRPDGSARIAALSTIPLPDDTAFGIAHDVTDQKRFLESLRESEAKTQVLFDKAVVGMALVGMNKRFTDCNEAFCAFTGYAKDELRTKTIADITHPEDLQKGYAEMKELVEGAVETATIEKRYAHKSGRTIWGELNIRLIRKESPADSYFLASLVDITERKKAEETDKMLIAENGMMLKEVHHRIKNNMGTINALLVMQAENLHDEAAIRALEEASKRVRSMEILYEKIYAATDFTELGVGEYLSPLIDDILGNFPNRPSVRTEKTFGDFAISVRKLQPLGIIVNELLTNIMKYAFTGRSGGTLAVSASMEKNLVTIAIRDDGNGMPESVSFERSTGFGLVLVNGLTRQLGGSIRIERGNGTRIVLEFEK